MQAVRLIEDRGVSYPKLAVQVNVNSFTEELEGVINRRLARGQQVNLPKVIEAKPVEGFKRRI